MTESELQVACATINEFIAGEVDVKAVPSQGAIAWVRVYPQGEYPFARNEAFQRLVIKGYNPQKMLDYAIAQATKSQSAVAPQSKLISTSRARLIAVNEFSWEDTDNTATRIRKAAIRGAVKAENDPVDGWRYDEADLRRWMANDAAHKPGPRRVED